MEKTNKTKREFSKTLLIQESALIWITTIFCLILGGFCVYRGYVGSLPWISSIIVSAWAAYGISQAMYYRKSLAENTEGGIKFETALKEANRIKDAVNNSNTINFDGYDATTTYTATTTYKATENTDDYQI